MMLGFKDYMSPSTAAVKDPWRMAWRMGIDLFPVWDYCYKANRNVNEIPIDYWLPFHHFEVMQLAGYWCWYMQVIKHMPYISFIVRKPKDHPKIFKWYRKFPKYSDTQNICCNHSKMWTMWLYHRIMGPKDADGMATSVDPDLGAVWSGSALLPRNICPKT